MSLAGGTQGWRLAGLDLESGLGAGLRPVSAEAAETARRRAAQVEARFAIRRVDHRALGQWHAETDWRTTHLLDVRTPEEFAAGHLPGSVSAPGGQLVQAIDRWVGTRGARLVLVDDTGARAVMTAHWLQQMGWDVQILDHALDGAVLQTGSAAPPVPGNIPALAEITPAEAAEWLAAGAASVSLDASAAYRVGHPAGAVWATRARLDRLPAAVRAAPRIVLLAGDPAAARLAAVDLGEITSAEIALARGGTKAWEEARLPLVETPDDPPDAERIDYLSWNHDRHAGNRAAMQAYLRWETELPEQVAADGFAGFTLGPP